MIEVSAASKHRFRVDWCGDMASPMRDHRIFLRSSIAMMAPKKIDIKKYCRLRKQKVSVNFGESEPQTTDHTGTVGHCRTYGPAGCFAVSRNLMLDMGSTNNPLSVSNTMNASLALMMMPDLSATES